MPDGAVFVIPADNMAAGPDKQALGVLEPLTPIQDELPI